MSVQETRRVLEERLNTEWNEQTPIAWDNMPFIPEAGESYISCTLEGVSSVPISLKCSRTNYLFVIGVHVPFAVGSAVAFDYVDQLLGIFFNFNVDRVLCKNGICSRVGQAEEWFHQKVTIEVQDETNY